ncbi:hypothetical protein U1Q18_008418 [Sarracenia purpurea var. burkii]
MSKETECKRRSPSIIARLMGLDGLPPQQPLHIQHKGSLETYQQRTTSVASQMDGKRSEHKLNRENSAEQQEFKDVHEVLETSKINRGSFPAKVALNPKISQPEMALTRKKFMDGKCPSTNGMLHNAVEFCDILEMMDPNKDLTMRFLKQPDSICTKHFLSLRRAALRSQCSHRAAIKSSTLEKFESNIIGWKSEKGILQYHNSSHSKYRGGLSIHSYSQRGAQKPLKSSKIQLDVKDETNTLPTRIIVLKPNLEKLRNAARSVSSQRSQHDNLLDCRKHIEYPYIDTGEEEPLTRKNKYSDAGFGGHKLRGSRELAKAISRKIRESFGSGPIDLSSPLRRYAGDESSYNGSFSDSSCESETTIMTSRNSFHRSNWGKPLSLHLIDSSIGKEEKKRLSKRWTMSQKYQDIGAVGKGSTLGEMLAIPGWEMRQENLDQRIRLYGSSSRGGRKDGCVRNSSRCKSLDQDNCLMPRKAVRNKAIKGNFNKKEDSSSRNLRSSKKKSQSPCCIYSNSNESLVEDQFKQSQIETNLGKKDPLEQKSWISDMPTDNANCKSSITDVEVDVEHEDMIMSSKSPDDLLPKPSPELLGNGSFSTPGSEDSKTQVWFTFL